MITASNLTSRHGEGEKKRKRQSEVDSAVKKIKLDESEPINTDGAGGIPPDSGTSTQLALMEQPTTHEATINPQQQSPLVRLPQEVRPMIYDYAFPKHDLFNTLEYCTPGVEALILPQPNLARSCRLLQAETLPLFYRRHEPIVIVNHYKQTHYFWDGKAPGHRAPWIDEMNNPDVAQIKIVLFLCRSTRDRAWLDDEECPEDVIFRASFDHPEPGVKIQYKIWHEETSAHLALWRDVDHPDDELYKTNFVFAEAGSLKMSKHGLCQNDTGLDRRNIRAFAELLLSLPRWPTHD